MASSSLAPIRRKENVLTSNLGIEVDIGLGATLRVHGQAAPAPLSVDLYGLHQAYSFLSLSHAISPESCKKLTPELTNCL
jgi:hypothetical protein